MHHLTVRKAIAYYRVSTERQGNSGLGLDAQATTISLFAKQEGYSIVDTFTEVETGRRNQRPQLQAALIQCKKQKATLIIAKLDRLSRKVAFISNLMDSKVDFRVVDNPYANRFQIHILAAFAEHERDQISKRTKEALEVAKWRGIELGKYGKEVLSKENIAAANDFAEKLRPVIESIQSTGITTIRAIRDELNRQQVRTFREGAEWHFSNVRNLLNRLNSTKQ